MSPPPNRSYLQPPGLSRRPPRLRGGGSTARSAERATATRPRALVGDQKPSLREADGNPESMARGPGGDTASRSPFLAPPYLAGFVELLFEPGHRHRGGALPGGGLGAPPGHAAATLSGAGTPGGPRAPHGHGHRHGAVTLAHARAQIATLRFEVRARPIGRASAACK